MRKYLYLPSGKGEKFHAKRCGAHHLKQVEFDEALVIIEREGYEPCQNCLKYHGLDSLLAGVDVSTE